MKNPLSRLSLVFVFFIFISPAKAQQSFSKVFNGNGMELKAYSIENTNDGNYFIAGQKENYAMIIKMDTAANIIWCKKYDFGSLSYSYFNKIVTTKDSGFILTGNTSSYGNNLENTLIVKLNSNGDTLWAKQIDLDDAETMLSVEQTYDGGYILTGYAHSFTGNLNSKIAVVKLDESGNLSWARKIVYGNNAIYAYAIKQLPDSSFVAIGYTEKYAPYDAGSCLIKLSPTGNVLWAKKHSGSYGWNLKIHNNALYCFLKFSSTLAIAKADFSANVNWSKSYAGNFPILNSKSNPKICLTSDMNFAIISDLNLVQNSLFMVDTSGNILNTKYISLSTSDIIEMYNKKFLIIGNGPLMSPKSAKNISDPEIGIIRTDTSQNYANCNWGTYKSSANISIIFTPITYTYTITASVYPISPLISNANLLTENRCVNILADIDETEANYTKVFTIYPNPTTGIFQLSFNKDVKAAVLEIYNVLGERIYISDKIKNKTAAIDLNNQPDGIYFLKVSTADKAYSQKIIISR